MRLKARLDRLEQSEAVVLSPELKAWLGWPLSEDEKQRLEAGVSIEPDWDEVDTSDWSEEAKAWLGKN